MSDKSTTLRNLQAMGESESPATFAGDQQCVESESTTEASVPGAFTREMFERCVERLKAKMHKPETDAEVVFYLSERSPLRTAYANLVAK